MREPSPGPILDVRGVNPEALLAEVTERGGGL